MTAIENSYFAIIAPPPMDAGAAHASTLCRWSSIVPAIPTSAHRSPQDTSAPVDPRLVSAISAFPDFDSLSIETLPILRAQLGAPEITETADLEVRLVDIPGANDHIVPGLLYRPRTPATSRAALLNIHGGGFVMGSAAREDSAMRRLALEHDIVILSVDYRLAPEAPYPLPLDDCVIAFEWLHASANDLGIDTNRIAIRGVSAGGGLAAGLALRNRDNHGPTIAWLWLLYPMLDDRTGPEPFVGKCVWTEAANRFGWSSYLGASRGDVSEYAAPARAACLRGFPNTFLATGSIDLFVGENVAFASRLMREGVFVEMHVYPGAYHGFNLVVDADVTRQYERDAASALSRQLLG